jgi:uncharacterized protein (TIGR03118 family)
MISNPWRRWLKSLRSQPRRPRLRAARLSLEALEDRTLPSVAITPEPFGTVGSAGHLVEFRKGPAGFISSPSAALAHGDALFALPVSDANVVADATDTGVAVINYQDSGVGNDFPNPRDVGIPPLTAVKRTDMASGGANPNAPNVNSGTFNPNAEDDEFAMESSGFIYIPTAGSWTFVVKSDAGFRLAMGTNNAVVGEFDGGRGPAYGNNQGGTIDSVANVLAAGYYPYHLLWIHGVGGAMAQFTAVQGSFPEPTDGSNGSLPMGSQLVGDTADGGLAVFQTFTPAPVATGVSISAVEGTPFSGTVATFTDASPGVTAANFSASINYGDGTAPVTVTSTASANGQIVADPSMAGQFDVQGIHTFEEGQFNVVVTVTNTATHLSGSTTFFTQTNLVTDDQTALAADGFAPAAHTDTHLVNPWGIASSSSSPSWVADNGAGVSTLYDGSGNPQSLVVAIPVANGGAGGATSPAPPTGIVFNGTSDFNVAGANTPAHFIFATEDGTIAAWNSGTSAVIKVDDADFTNGPVYKGLAIGNNGSANFLYATNFRTGAIDVFDKNFNKVTLAGNFTDPTTGAGALPSNFAPFGIQNIGGQLYVTYAMQNAARHDDVKGLGNGFVDVFDASGHFVKRLASNGALDSPWGLALAPATFGAFAGDLLVGNFGDGHINVFNPNTNAFLGQLSDGTGVPVVIDGLWGLRFGNNGTAGPASTLFFAAGIADESHGLFGSLTANEASTASVGDAALLPGIAAGGSMPFTGVGGTNTSTTAGTANAALTNFKTAIGGSNNGGTAVPQANGFRTINWDGVPLNGNDPGFSDTVIDPGHVVGIPINRFQERGAQFDSVYPVSGPASATDPSTFSTVNPSVAGLFPAFSPANTFAMFNDNTIDVSFVLASAHTTTPVPAATRGFGAIFRNVAVAGATSIEYFNGDESLGKFFAPVGAAGQAEFLGELFSSPIVTRVHIILGTDVLFSFDGTHFTAGPQPDDPVHGHNLVVADDFAYAEPVALSAGQSPIKATAGTPFSGPVAVFSDLNPLATVHDYTAAITWGDGHTSPGVVSPRAGGGFTVSGTNTYMQGGSFTISVLVQDLGGSSVTIGNAAAVEGTPVARFPLSFGVGTNGIEAIVNLQAGGQVVDAPAPIPGWTGEIHRAVGDLNGDLVPDTVWAAGPGGGPRVRIIAGGTGAVLADFFAFNPAFTGGVNLAVADVNGDGVPDVIVAAGPGGGPHLKVIDGTKLNLVLANGEISDSALLASFFAYDPTFTGGVNVAAADINGDSHADIITGAGPGGGPHAKVIDGTKVGQVQANGEIANAALLASFFAFAPSFTGGVNVAAGDFNGDGTPDVIVGAGAGSIGPMVRVLNGSALNQVLANGEIAPSASLANFQAFAPGFTGGVRVDAVDVNGDGKQDIVTGAGAGGGPAVEVFRGTDLALVDSFFATDPMFAGGVFV